jgi:hypothetical protein
MRLWTLHPKYLDARGLVALWREALLAQPRFFSLRSLRSLAAPYFRVVRMFRGFNPSRIAGSVVEKLDVLYASMAKYFKIYFARKV